MYTFHFLQTPAQQRRAFVSAETFGPVPLHPTTQELVDQLNAFETLPEVPNLTRWSLFREGLATIRPLVLRQVFFSLTGKIATLISVFLLRDILAGHPSLLVAIALAVSFFLLRQLQAGSDYLENVTGVNLSLGLKGWLLGLVNRAVLRLDRDTAESPSTAEIKNVLSSDIDAIGGFLTHVLRAVVPALMTFLVVAPALLVCGSRGSGVAMVVALIIVPLSVVGGMAIEAIRTKGQDCQDKVIALVSEWVSNIRLVRFLNTQESHTHDICQTMRVSIFWGAIQHLIGIIVWGLSFSWWSFPVIVLVASANWEDPRMSMATLFFSMWLLGLFSEQLRYIPQALNQLGSALSASDRVLRVLQAPRMDRHFITVHSSVVDPSTRQSEPLPRFPASIVLNDVTVELGGRAILEHLNLSFNLNERTAIIGRLGSGKSVLLSLLTGERSPIAGTCIVHFSDGSSGSLWEERTYEEYRQAIATSQQQPFLSNTSLLRNIDLGGNYPEDDVVQACSQAQLHADIALLNRGLHEEVGEHGINLSGGQKQRVSVARAFMSRRPILILDDPLSAVDVKTESALAAELFNVARGMIIVSHRLTELLKCDRILVLDSGRVIEDGPPTTLLAADGAFVQFMKAFELTYE